VRTNLRSSQRSGATMEDQTIVGAVSGEFVTETFDYDGGRQVTVYVSQDPPEAVVFAGDGQFISQWGEVLETADVPSTMIVGVHGLADETPRLREYSPAFAPERFATHARGSSSRTSADGRAHGLE
jgi:hypothetical protein